MLEIRNLTKIYKTKGGSTRALDDVTLTFPETGMVFLLGKSGSGKSTLLNVCGGLDFPTSGEIIVRGRSSKTFSGSDFDSYRNTFIGFIFQEYNILNEFTVEENLSIALELQGKPRDRQKVAELLREVDLEGYAKRKPNTLSGGQKQRIAIARALIKDPRIIMADEPTGALDSATGKQVFDTLKRLSQTRLVIVVSHDREFAEIYGDRIIELKDGKVICDITKWRVPSATVSENVSVIGDDVLSVKKGAKLTEDDVEKIKDFVLTAGGGVIISRGEQNVNAYKRENRIGEDDSMEKFFYTDPRMVASRPYAKEESKFVRSHLPVGKAIKMGASSLKVKPFRLFLTILLSVIAFIMFGVFSTLMTYNENNVVRESFANSTYNVIKLSKNYYYTERYFEGDKENYSYESSNTTLLTAADVTALENSVGKVLPYVSFSNGGYGGVSVYNLSASAQAPRTLTDFTLTGFALSCGATDIAPILYGRCPSAVGEIAVSKYFADVVIKNDYYALDESGNTEKDPTRINSVNEILNKNVAVRISGTDVVLKVVGVFDGGDIPAKYEGYDSVEQSATWDYMQLYEYGNFINETLHKVALVADGFYADVIEKTGYRFINEEKYDYDRYFKYGEYFYRQEGDNNVTFGVNSYAVYDANASNMLPVYFFDGVVRSVLTGNDVIVPLYSLPRRYDALTQEQLEIWKNSHAAYGEKSQQYNDIAQEYMQKDYDSLSKKEKAEYDYYCALAYLYEYLESNPVQVVEQINNIMSAPRWDDYYPTVEPEVVEDAKSVIIELYRDFYPKDELNMNIRSDMGDSTFIYIVGFYFDPSAYDEYYNTGLYVSEEKYPVFENKYGGDYRWERETKYALPEADFYYDGVFVPYGEGQKGNIENVLKINKIRAADDSFYAINNTLYESIMSISEMVESMSKVFLYVGIAMAAFAALLLFNFISVSINSKMHEIGVLRAVGARGVDVFKIFFSESFIISLICIILSVGATIGLVIYLNAELTTALKFSLHLLVFGPIPVAMMIGVAVVVAFLGTFFPVVRIASKKPVDSMKG